MKGERVTTNGVSHNNNHANNSKANTNNTHNNKLKHRNIREAGGETHNRQGSISNR